MSQWISIESRRHLALGDQELVLQFVDEVEQARQLAARLPAVLRVMRDDMAGHPRAASTGRGDGPPPWCWEHERSTLECDRAGLVCAGEVIAGPSDPTGSAAVIGDRAAENMRLLRREVEQLQLLLHRVVKLTAPYPTEHLEREFVEATPGDEWCRSCWRDDKHCEPITRKPNGRPYYDGLCKWCGSFRAEHGCNPPVVLLQRRHRGEVIRSTMVAQALKEARSESAKPRSKKGRKAS